MAFFQTRHLWINQLADGVATLVLDDPDSKTNLLTAAFLADLERALDEVVAGQFKVLVLKSNKGESFCGGVDPRWLAELSGPDAFAELARRGQQLSAKLADLPLPSVAVVSGACLGAGLELALACDYRVAVDQPATVFGFPQVELGLIPAWGGTQRLPRLIGFENSLSMLLGGRRWHAREAQDLGLVDALVENNDDAPPAFLADHAKRDWTRFQRRTLRQRLLESLGPGRWMVFRGAERVLREKLPEDLPAPWEALEALRVAARSSDLQPGLDFERQALQRLGDSPAFRNLLRFQQQREQRRREARQTERGEPIRKIGLIGIGDRSLALLYQAAMRGSSIVLQVSDKDALGLAIFQIYGILGSEVQRGVLTEQKMEQTLANIRGTVSWQYLDEVDAIFDCLEDAPAQRLERFRTLERVTGKQTLLVNTSPACTVSQLREGLQHPRRVAGLHFIEPQSRGSLVEIVQSEGADPAALRRLSDWVHFLGRTAITTADRPGLLVLRILLPALNEAALLVKEGASPEQIDLAMTRFGMAQGPLEYVDQLGTDAVANLIEALQPLFEERLEFETGFALMAERNWLGMKSGVGFHQYHNRKRKAHPQAALLWHNESEGEPVEPLPALSLPDLRRLVQRRLAAIMVLEAARCLQEGIVADAETLDFALVTTGWAPHRGGPLSYARQLGRNPFLAEAAELSAHFGPRFDPPLEALDVILGERPA